MKYSKKIKKGIIILLTIVLCMLITVPSMAAINPDDYKPVSDTSGDTQVAEMGGKILGIISTIASVAALFALLFMGIKYMIGSVDQKAEYKKTMIPYIIGALMAFAGGTIVNLIYLMMQ